MNLSSESRSLLIIADEDSHLRERLRTLLEPDGYRIADADAPDSCLALVEDRRPAGVIVGRVGNITTSLALAARIIECVPPPPVLMLIDAETDDMLDWMERAGVDDYLLRDSRDGLVRRRIRRLARIDAARQSPSDRLLDQAPVMIWTADATGNVGYVNRMYLDFTGRSRADVLRDGGWSLLHPDDESRCRRRFESALQAQESLTLEYRLRRADGAYRWILDVIQARTDEQGGFDGYIGSCVDITEQKRAEEALQATHTRLQAVFQAAPLAITSTDNDGVFQQWNPAAEGIFGWTAAEIVGKPYTWVFDPVQVDDLVLRVRDGEALFDVATRCRHKNGTPIDISASVAPLHGPDGQVDGFIGILTDVTERRRSEAAEREQRQLADALRDAGAALVSTLDAETVMSRILDTVGRVVPHDSANVMVVEGRGLRLVHSRGYLQPLEQVFEEHIFDLDLPNFRQMFATGESCLIADVQTAPDWVQGNTLIRSYLGTPIKAHGEVVGFLNLDSRTPGAFTEQDAERLHAFANQVAIAIENAQLYEALRRDAAELNRLHRATALLFRGNLYSMTSLDDLGYHVARTVVDEFGQLDCGVMLVDRTRGQLLRLARAGAYGVDVRSPLYIEGAGLVPEAVRSGKVIYAPDVAQDSRYIPSDPRTRSELVIPLLSVKGVIGVLDLQSAQADAFGEHDQRVLQAFAEQASAAFENMLLYDEVRRYSLDLEQRISERTAELHRVKERVEAILNNSSDAILMVYDDGTIEQTNHTFNRLFRYQAEAMFGQPLSMIASPDYRDMLMRMLRSVQAENRPARLEIAAVTANGDLFDADLALSPIADFEAHVTSVVVSLRDITARKRVETELRHALDREKELSDLKSRFIATVSHEFRTPLSIIMTSADMLKTYGHRLNPADQHERLGKIQSEVQNVTALLDDLLTVSRARHADKAEFDPASFDMPTVSREIIREVETGIGSQHEIRLAISGDFPTTVMDVKLLRRILINLLTNSVKYSPSGSSISVTLICEDDRKIICVEDEGIGIPDDDQKNLFDAFHRARNVGNIAGTGLGLAIVKHAVDLHGGDITITSQVNAGTSVTITIPESRLREDAP